MGMAATPGWTRRALGAAGLALALVAAPRPAPAEEEPAFTIRSAAFDAGGTIPARYTCDGADVSPPLSWSGLPEGTRSLALLLDDPDAPGRTWVHWVLYDLPASSRGLPEAAEEAGLPPGTRRGRNGWERSGYGGPCPPSGRHRYVFRLYALDRALGDLGSPGKAELLEAMEGHVLATAERTAAYARAR